MDEPFRIFCGHALTPSEQLENVLIEVEAGRISKVVPNAPATDRAADFADCLAVPGFMDIHLHGGNGFDIVDGTYEAVSEMSSHLARHGVTSFLPAVVTSSLGQMVGAMQAVRQAVDGGVPGAQVLGAHLEGPYLNVEFKGAQPPEHVRVPSVKEFEDHFGDHLAYIRLVTLAPEVPGATDLIEFLVSKGIVVSAGHSAARYDEMLAAINTGLRNATHTFNAMRQFHHREPGIVGAILSDDRVFAELIWDNLHVHPGAAKVLVKAKGPGRVMLISDAMRAAGLPDGEYELGGQKVFVRNGTARLADDTIAGSTITLDQAVRNAAQHVGLRSAAEMASLTPATSIRVADKRGAIAPGLAADLTILDHDLHVRAVIISGRLMEIASI